MFMRDTTFSEGRQQGQSASALASGQVAGERLLTVREAARALGMCTDSVRRHLRSGKLQGVRVGGGWRVPESKLALQLGLISAANRPAFEAMEAERQRQEPKTAMAVTTLQGGDDQLLEVLFQTAPVRVRVQQIVEAAAIAAAIPASTRAQLARELERVLCFSDETVG